MVIQKNPREVYATNIQNEIFKNPAGVQNLICVIAHECSMADFERIYIKFMSSLNEIQESKNLTN